MRVLLINTPTWMTLGVKTSYNPGMGLLYIGAVLRQKGHDVKIIDAEAYKWMNYDILQFIDEWKPTHVGIGSLSNGLSSAITLTKEIKQKYPNLWVALGGVGPSCEPEYALKESGADSVTIGEAEQVVEKSFNEKGIHQGVPIEDLDSLPFPAYDLLEPPIGSQYWLGNLPRPEFSGPIRETVVMWSRGCPHACTFCSKGTIARGKTRMRKPENIVKELLTLYEKFQINSVFVYDDELIGMSFAHNEWMRGICEEIIRVFKVPKIALKGQGRCNTKFIDRRLFSQMRKSGFFAMMMGCESGSDDVKKELKKGTTNEDIRQTLKALDESDIKIYGFWMIGLPKETNEQAEQTKKLIEEVAPYMDWIQISILSPLPGSTFWNEAKEKGYMCNYDPTFNAFQIKQPMLSMPWMSRDDVQKWQIELHKAFENKKRAEIERTAHLRQYYIVR